MNIMTYKGYTASVIYDKRDRIFVGRVLGIKNKINFKSTNVDDLSLEFNLAVDYYLSDCARNGIKPEKPVTGRFMVSVSPELHVAMIQKAKSLGKNINQWAVEILSKEITETID